MNRLFTSEAVSEGHPDKVADQISDAILDAFLSKDRNSHVACETMVTTGLVVLSGEIKSEVQVDVEEIVRNTISNIGYNDSKLKFDANSCGIINLLHSQSTDIDRGVDKVTPSEQGAGDQGIMFGYATDEAPEYMPLAYYIANKLMLALTYIRKETELMPYLRPDAKSQVTIEYDGEVPVGVDSILISTQHDEFATDKAMLEKISLDVKEILLPLAFSKMPCTISSLFNENTKLYVNPTGKFVIGGPYGDTGLTGRKIIADTYGGYCPHGGGAFSGKDPSKVDRSGAYAARFLAKNFVANGIAKRMTIQIGYAIGMSNPVSVFVEGMGYSSGWNDDTVSDYIKQTFKLTPYEIIKNLRLRSPIYNKTAAYGHFGHKSFDCNGVLYYPWEFVDKLNNLKI